MILAIDQGTTGTTCLVFDAEAELIGRSYREFGQHFPQPGWVEHDAAEIWDVTRAVALEALEDAGVGPGGLQAVGITNQRETVCVWDPATGEPLHRALVWQDRRTAARCDELRERGYEPLVRDRTGLVLDPYFSGTKIAWLLEHVDGLAERARRRARGVRDDRLLAGVQAHGRARDRRLERLAHDAARHPRGRMVGGALRAARRARCARCRRSARRSASSGAWRGDALPGHDGTPLAGIAGDQQSALYGQACLDPGQGKNTYGTGSFVLVNTGGDPPPVPPPGLLATVAWSIGRRTTYALEASIFVTGAGVQWLRDGLGIIENAAQTQELAASLEGNDGVYFVPALTGLGSPHWDPYARGTIVGLTRGTGRAHLARATLEAIAYQTVDAVRAIEAAGAQPLSTLKADGGRDRQRLADAVPGRRARRPGRRAAGRRDDGARRGDARRRRRGGLDAGPRDRAVARGCALRAARSRPTSAGRCSQAGRAR